jgi:hypothetical protein
MITQILNIQKSVKQITNEADLIISQVALAKTIKKRPGNL